MRKALLAVAVILATLSCSKEDAKQELPNNLPERVYCTTGETYDFTETLWGMTLDRHYNLITEFHFNENGGGVRTVYYERLNMSTYERYSVNYGYFSFIWSVSGNTITVNATDHDDNIADTATLTIGENHQYYWDGTYNGRAVTFRLYKDY